MDVRHCCGNKKTFHKDTLWKDLAKVAVQKHRLMSLQSVFYKKHMNIIYIRTVLIIQMLRKAVTQSFLLYRRKTYWKSGIRHPEILPASENCMYFQ